MAAAVDFVDRVVAALDAASTREQAARALRGLSRADLLTVADYLNVEVGASSDAKVAISRRLVAATVGARLDAVTVSAVEPDGAAALAAGLRQLAAMVLEQPHLAGDLRLGVDPMLVSVGHGDDDARAQMLAFARAGRASGASVTEYDNGTHAGVDVAFGPVRLQVYAAVDRIVDYAPRSILVEFAAADGAAVPAAARTAAEAEPADGDHDLAPGAVAPAGCGVPAAPGCPSTTNRPREGATPMDDATPAVVAHADAAYEAIRAINHLTFGTIPAPLAYQILGNLKGVGHLMPQALGQIGEGLAASLDEYQVYEDDGADPAGRVAQARGYLAEAAAKAAEVGRLLEAAQSAISRQAYRVAAADDTDIEGDGDRRDPDTEGVWDDGDGA